MEALLRGSDQPDVTGMPSHCRGDGWILGNAIDETQAEYVRIPHADTSVHPLPPDADEEAMAMLSDTLPTGFECGVLDGPVRPGTAQLYSPAEIVMIDLDEHRLQVASSRSGTKAVIRSDGKAVQGVMDLTGGAGVDVAIEAVGILATFDICRTSALTAPSQMEWGGSP
jgi:alcohol dehydrogenase